ncbi:hypothetical protein AK88_01257 [Plasmodium fragile]|uniref:Schizont-infected cell agglutination C-terminal domain-containing protein n=1 Tax=Plasmodium fragile TaxID=5857 RepID=A0A0D9QTS6_PLAFR|nr:uncharacterized protein AK88_01257 [Plasmodium fragile]KJP89171.1 hypothetical protein AK88_01257 [Plasmodium fragile]
MPDVSIAYEQSLWQDIKTLLEEFVKYMEDEDLDIYAANCLNAGYKHPSIEQPVLAKKVADRLMCTLMSRALFFMNGWRPWSASADDTDHKNAELKEHIRCAIVNIFMYILNESPCKSQMGVYYAWYTMQKMEPHIGRGLITKGKCGKGVFQNIKKQEFNMGNKIQEWLEKKKTLTEKIGGEHIQSICKKELEELDGVTTGTHKMGDKIEMQPEEKEAITTLGQKLKVIVEEVQTAAVQCAQANGACMDPNGDAGSSDVKDDETESIPPNSVESATPAQSGNVDGKESATSGPVGGKKPAAPSRASPGPIEGGSEKAGKDDVADKTKQPGHGATPAVNENTTDTMSPAGSGQTHTTVKDPALVPLTESTTGQHPTDPPASDSNGGSSSSGGGTSGRESSSSSSSSSGTGAGDEDFFVAPDNTPLWGIGQYPTAPEQNRGGGQIQERAKGSRVGSTVNVLDDKYCTFEDHKKQCDIGFDLTTKKGTKDPGGGYTPPTLPKHELSPKKLDEDGRMEDDYAVPDLTGDILTATTPVLFFLTSVIVALLGYSLWKYFAYLAKRRRTFRTVRDVPSPPLDEEILQHLQRPSAPPPPDYGRTIIELHLEVLHECAATEWENVKDDYLHILVEEFMGRNNGHRSSLDAPITNQALSGNNVSSIDSQATDPSAPHDCDTSSCVETIQLETDPCPPHDPDPWSCKETIPLATDTSPPHDSDPWKCMETTQLATEPCPPHDSVLCPVRANANSAPDHTNWINWIHRNTHLLQECTTQPWFLQLKVHWKQYLREHMAERAHNGQRALGERGHMPSVEMKKDAWKKWVAQQHRHMRMYTEQWFQRLLNNVEDHTVPQKGEVARVDKHLEVEKVKATEDVLRVRHLPRTQLHQQPYMQQPLTGLKLCMLLLAFVIEQCELERSLQEKELYVDALLEKL